MKIEGEKRVNSSPGEPSYGMATRRSVFWTGILLGVGIMAFLDETILHKLLQWHTFYWNTDQHGRILSDGIFHAFSTLLLLLGTFLLWRGRATWAISSRFALVAAILIGAGGFNLYGGGVQARSFQKVKGKLLHFSYKRRKPTAAKMMLILRNAILTTRIRKPPKNCESECLLLTRLSPLTITPKIPPLR